MGFFDKFKKKNNQYDKNISDNMARSDNSIQPTRRPLYDIEYDTNQGKLQVDFYDMQADFKKFYDTTRLVISPDSINMAGHQVYNAAVSWYGQNDCQMLDTETGKMESARATMYRDVLMEINLELLKSDPEYCRIVMQSLLDQKRVERYLDTGLEETPEQPCGKYIGGIRTTEKGYGKFFATAVGKASHNSGLMVNRRQEYRRMKEAERQRNLAAKKAQITKLQDELYSEL